ncbi:MAG: type I phosphomannose isomerase catalytic subunit [Terriglobales bacterium]
MTELYPLLLKPEFRERIWGRRDLSPIYGEAPGDTPIGEVWLTGDDCRVANGTLAGMSLGELCRRYGRELVGETAREAERFPLLVKFIFPRDKLSVQVHPDDETARRAGLPCGKTECWYVLKAEAGSQVGLGLKPGTTREEFARAIEEVRAEQLLNWMDIHAGEMIYVDAGTVHAISPGSILVETQQNSDTTYRLYDYGRPRELHVQQGLAALKERTRAGKVEPWVTHENLAVLIWSACFLVAKHKLGRNADLSMEESNAGAKTYRKTVVIVGLKGCGVVETNDAQPVAFGCGEAVVVPAAVDWFRVIPQWDVEFLTMKLPSNEHKEDLLKTELPCDDTVGRG